MVGTSAVCLRLVSLRVSPGLLVINSAPGFVCVKLSFCGLGDM